MMHDLRLSGKDVLIVIYTREKGDEIFVSREPLDGLQFVGSEPFSSFVLEKGIG